MTAPREDAGTDVPKVRSRDDLITAAAHKAAEIGFTYGALGRDFEYALKNVDEMLAALDVAAETPEAGR